MWLRIGTSGGLPGLRMVELYVHSPYICVCNSYINRNSFIEILNEKVYEKLDQKTKLKFRCRAHTMMGAGGRGGVSQACTTPWNL
jgi:hypothetical protein